MKVLLASADDATDPGAWSGTAYQARSALQAAGHEVVLLTGLPTTRAPWHLAARAILGRDRYPLWMTRSTLRRLAQRLECAEREHRPDVILSISSQYLVEAHLITPVVIFSDAPWQTFRERYSRYQQFASSPERFERREAAAARRAHTLVYSSEWARAEAVRLFGVQKDRIEVVALGANWTPEGAPPPPPALDGPIELLFIGRDWRRKGGDFAVAIQQAMRSEGVDARLTVVGVDASTLGADASMSGVTVIGRTGILDNTQVVSMPGLFARSHLVVVPSRAECFGIVFAEAAAFARPAVGLRVDAVGEVVLDDVTGLLFDPQDSPTRIAEGLLALVRDPERYALMASAARQRFSQLLNWAAFGTALTAILERATR